MTSPRRPVIRRARPDAAQGGVVIPLGAQVPAADQAQAVAAGQVDPDQAMRQEVIDDFEASLRDHDGLDPEGLAFLLDTFRDAVNDTPLDAQLQPLDAHAISQNLDALVTNGVLEEDDRNALSRQLNDALAPLQRPQVQLATEYAQRIARDGEAEALAWYQEQTRKLQVQDAAATQDAPGDFAGFNAHDAITSSRSRRLRGPPRR